MMEYQGIESYFCGISRMYTVLAKPVHVFKITEKHVGIKITSFNKITKLTKYNQCRK